MLSLLGNDPAEVALLAFSGRPLLAFLLNVGAPVVAVTGTLKYQYPLEVLKSGEGPFPVFSGTKSSAIAVIEHLLAAAAAVNVALLGNDIASKAVYVPDCGRTWYAFLWMYLCLILHPLTLLAFWSRSGISYVLKKESYLYLFLEWVLSHGAIIQIIFGTLVLSASTLIDTFDAFRIVGRYAASAILCRLILMYELYGMRAAVTAGTVHVA
ncbi:MAG: hypothetical protein Q9228_007116 [Teloschistes exilis]